MTIELANRLAELRKEHGLSQEELADKLQVSRQAISKWERGEASPDTDNLIELAKIYNISLDELVGLSGEKQAAPKAEAKDHVEINDDGVHVYSEDGEEVHVTEHGIKVTDKDGTRDVQLGKKHRVDALVSVITVFGVVIAYILLGSLLGLWGQAWVLFLLIPITPTIPAMIRHKNPNIFCYPVFIAFLYLLLCVWVFNFSLFHPLWVLFLTIPMYYGVINFFGFKDKDEDKDEDKDD